MLPERPAEAFRYWAFISYSHSDEAWARWLHQALETYPVPKRLVGKIGHNGVAVPARAYPVFLDRDELPGSAKLTDQIEAALRDSRYLIVVCSPRAATSQWVNQEIRMFKAFGREDRVLCFIIDGEPNADQKPKLGLQECFPEAARFWVDSERQITDIPTEPIAADARRGKDGKANALLKLLSGILGVDYNDFKQRAEERRRKQFEWILAGTLALLMLVLTVSVQFYFQKEQALRAERRAEGEQRISETARDEARVARDEARRALADEIKAKLAAENARRQAEAAARQERLAKEKETQAREQESAARTSAERARNEALQARNEAVANETRMRRVLSISDLTAATRLVEDNDDAKALAYLSRALRYDRDNPAVVTRLISLLSQRNWPLPNEPLRHDGEVKSAAFSPDGRHLATVCGRSAKLWDAHTGQVLRQLVHGDLVNCLVFSPDGKKLATASRDKTAQIWDADTGVKLGEALHHDAAVNVVTFSPDNTLIATGTASHRAHVWRVTTGREMIRAVLNPGPVRCLDFHPKGDRLLIGAKNSAQVWDLTKQQASAGPLSHEGGIYSAVFSPSGQYVATASGDKTARIWETATGLPLSDFLQHSNWVNSIQFSPDERWVVTASSDCTAKVWEVPRGRVVLQLHHQGEVLSAAFSPNAQMIVTASADYTASVWHTSSGKPALQPLRHGGTIFSAAFSPDGRSVVTASADCSARIWSTVQRKPVFEPLRHNQTVNTAIFSPNGKCVATASADRTARLWEVGAGRPLTEPLRHEDGVITLAFSPDGKWLATGAQDGNARLWSTENGNSNLHSFKHQSWINSVAFSPDGRWLATASEDSTACIWDVASGLLIAPPLAHDGAVQCAFFSPDGQWLITTLARKIQIWNTSGKLIHTLRQNLPSSIYSAAISPDGKWIAAGFDDNRVVVWNALTGSPVGAPVIHEAPVNQVAFAPAQAWSSHKWLLTVSDKIARIWDVETGKAITEPIKHSDSVRTASFSPNGSMLVSAHGNSVQLWEATTGKPLSDPLQHEGSVQDVRFSADGQLLVTSSADRTARIWFIAPAGKAPEWLDRLADALSGYHLGDFGAAQLMENSAQLLRETCRSMIEGPADPFSTWGKWLSDSSPARTMWAFGSTPLADYIQRRTEEASEESLAEALHMAPSHGLALGKLALRAKYPAQAEFLSSLALRYEPDNPEVLWIRACILQEQNKTADHLAIMQRALMLDPRNVTTFSPQGAEFYLDNKEGVIAQGWLPKGWIDHSTGSPMKVAYKRLDDLPQPGLVGIEMRTSSQAAEFAQLLGPRLVCRKNTRCYVQGWARSPYKSDIHIALVQFTGQRENVFQQVVHTTTEWKPFKIAFSSPQDLAVELVIREPSEAVVHLAGVYVRQE